MSLGSFLHYSKTLAPDVLSFCYQGEFTDDFTEKIIELSEYNINNKAELKKSRKKFSFLVAECFQNVVRHGKNPVEVTKKHMGYFATRNIDRTFFITSANLIPNSRIDGLKSQLEKVNGLDKAELKQYYREVLSGGEFSNEGGAGLGLIEMARRSGSKLEYSFEDINGSFSYFYLQIRICGTEDCLYEDVTLDDQRQLHRSLMLDKILLMYKGDFATDSIMPVLNMIEQNVSGQDEEFKVKKRVYKMAVELLQNIVQHARRSDEGVQEGLFLIGKKGDHYMMATGNYMEMADVEKLEALMEKINSLDKENLTSLFKSILFEGASSPEGDGSRLGLIDVARDAEGKLEYQIDKFDERSAYFSLSVRI